MLFFYVHILLCLENLERKKLLKTHSFLNVNLQHFFDDPFYFLRRLLSYKGEWFGGYILKEFSCIFTLPRHAILEPFTCLNALPVIIEHQIKN